MRSRWFVVFTAACVFSAALPLAQQPASSPRQEAQQPRPGGAIVKLPPANVANGKYLAERVAMCVECHSGRDGSGNIIASEEYMGGPIPFTPPPGWAMRAPRNRGLFGYNDEAAMRLLMQGAIDRHGNQLRPPMPRFRMSLQDAADVIAFLRSFP